jgi:hypothetical protein
VSLQLRDALIGRTFRDSTAFYNMAFVDWFGIKLGENFKVMYKEAQRAHVFVAFIDTTLDSLLYVLREAQALRVPPRMMPINTRDIPRLRVAFYPSESQRWARAVVAEKHLVKKDKDCLTKRVEISLQSEPRFFPNPRKLHKCKCKGEERKNRNKVNI